MKLLISLEIEFVSSVAYLFHVAVVEVFFVAVVEVFLVASVLEVVFTELGEAQKQENILQLGECPNGLDTPILLYSVYN